MAVHAGAIPCSERIVFFQLRWDQECLRHGRPHFFCDDVRNGELLQGAALARFQPKNLQVVRAGRQDDLLWLAVVAPLPSNANKEFIAAAFSFVFATVEGVIELAHVIEERSGRRDLSHGAMKRSMPAFVVLDMTSSARI